MAVDVGSNGRGGGGDITGGGSDARGAELPNMRPRLTVPTPELMLGADAEAGESLLRGDAADAGDPLLCRDARNSVRRRTRLPWLLRECVSGVG